MPDLYSASNYRSYLKDWIFQRPGKGRGQISALAQEARCAPAYFSRVLLGRADLSQEQAYAIQGILGHSNEDTQFFILLLDRDRAGDQKWKAFCERRLAAARDARTDLKKRFKDATELSPEAQAVYYSSAHYAAIHASLSVPAFQRVVDLEKLFKLSVARIHEVLGFLESTGLAVQRDGRWEIGSNRLHLGRDSNLIRQHHTNWRLEALKSLDRGIGAQSLQDLHYSSVVTVSQEDATKLREHWIRALEEFNRVVAPSREETVRALVIDFFALG
jgi:hypothetical protein